MKRASIPVFILLFCLVISGCNVPTNSQAGVKVNAVFTGAARTLEARLTELPASSNLVLNPTDTPIPDEPILEPLESATEAPTQFEPSVTPQPTITNTPAPTAVCDSAQFLADVTFPDGTVVRTGEFFKKTWRFKNTGVCAWNSSYSMIFDVGDQMGGLTTVPLPDVAPGDEVELSVEFQAPAQSGTYRSYWRLRNPGGVMLPIAGGYKNKSFYVEVRVKESVSGMSSREFGVSRVDFVVTHSGSCSAGTYIVTAKITANAAGEVSYLWKRSDGTTDPTSDGKVTFQTAGVQMVTYHWSTGATGVSVMFEVLTPKQQEFGPALLYCVP